MKTERVGGVDKFRLIAETETDFALLAALEACPFVYADVVRAGVPGEVGKFHAAVCAIDASPNSAIAKELTTARKTLASFRQLREVVLEREGWQDQVV